MILMGDFFKIKARWQILHAKLKSYLLSFNQVIINGL